MTGNGPEAVARVGLPAQAGPPAVLGEDAVGNSVLIQAGVGYVDVTDMG
jgi:hypothetical protein